MSRATEQQTRLLPLQVSLLSQLLRFASTEHRVLTIALFVCRLLPKLHCTFGDCLLGC